MLLNFDDHYHLPNSYTLAFNVDDHYPSTVSKKYQQLIVLNINTMHNELLTRNNLMHKKAG